MNFSSGELLIEEGNGASLRLGRDRANRLILAARMQTVSEFLAKLPSLIPQGDLVQAVHSRFEKGAPSERWMLKEKIARLQTLTKGYEAAHPGQIVETVEV